MILGIDVGGTHTDAVLFENLQVRKKTKVLTKQGNLIESLIHVADEILCGENLKALDRIVFSTTISTNAIVQGKTERVGLIVAGGPGMPLSHLRINDDTHFVAGYVNHRGDEVASVDAIEISKIRDILRREGIGHLGVVGKFSTRNPRQEVMIRDMLDGDFRHISLGHRISGNLNFPRRISTTYLNAAVWDLYNAFVGEILKLEQRLGIKAPIYVLKADGGTFEVRQSAEFPVCTILSGPAASIMGILSLTRGTVDAVAMDIGGTTTDIAVFSGGVPLLEPLGVTIEGHKTLIRGLKTRSLGVGGDSRVRYENGAILIGPGREGPAAAFGGPCPTPTDAMVVLGLAGIGEAERAAASIGGIAREMNLPVEETAEKIFEAACGKIAAAVREMIREINDKPVYTIHEMLEGKRIKPQRLYIVGGPAVPMAPRLGEILGCRAVIPPHAEVANAIGAALARSTTEVTLLADTERKTLTIPEEGLQSVISGAFTRDEAIRICKEKLRERAVRTGARDEDVEMEIVEDLEFHMIRGATRTGKNIRLKAQVKPGLLAGFSTGADS